MRFSITIGLIVLLFTSCREKSTPYDFSPLPNYKIVSNSKKQVLAKKLFTLRNEIPLPKFVGKVYSMDSSWGTLYFCDKNRIYKYKNGKITKYFTPSKGRGPDEVSSIFRFDVIKDTLVIVGDYHNKRMLVHKIKQDTTYIFQNSYISGIQIDADGNFFAEQSNNHSNKMFIKFNTEGDTLNNFGHLFKNQYRSLNAFNMWVDGDNKGDEFVIGFLNAGYYTAFKKDGSILFLAKSMQYPGNIPKLIRQGNMSFIDTEGKVVTGYITLYHDKFYVMSSILGDENGKIIGSYIDVMSSKTGKYLYSFKLNRYVKKFEMVNDSTIAGITNNFTLGIWKKNKKD